MKILAMTAACVDYYPQQDFECVGGNSINFLSQCMRQGDCELAFLGRVGEDRYGDMVVRHLRAQGYDLTHFAPIPGETAHNRLVNDEHGERFGVPGAWVDGVFGTFRLGERDWEYAREHGVVAMPATDPNFVEAVHRLGRDTRLVVDMMHLRDFGLIRSVAPRVEIMFFAGGRELLPQVEALYRELDKPAVVTMGAGGSAGFYKGRFYEQPALAVECVVDTTGCGDNFQAAFVMNWLRERDMQAALRCGAEAATTVIGHYGGTATA